MLLTMIKKGFAQQNKNSKNKSIVDKEKEKYERVPYVACECACEITPPYVCSGKMYRR